MFIQKFELKMKPLWLAAAFATATTAASAADTQGFPLGTAKPHATIIAQAGIGMEWAWATAQVTQDDAAAYCQASGAGELETCVTDLLAAEKSRLHTIMADCSAGSLSIADRQSFSRQAEGASWQDRQGTLVDDPNLGDYWTVLCAPDLEAVALAEQQAGQARAEREAEIAMLEGVLATMTPPPAQQLPAPEPAAVASAPAPVAAVAAPVEPVAAPAEPVWSRAESIVGIDHNGSLMWHDAQQGLLYYDRPKASLDGLADRGTILFQGEPWSFDGDFIMRGTAYTFRKGCAPAPYAVEGGFVGGGPDRLDRIVLRGASPIRQKGGCAILGYTNDSPNAELVFQLNYGDV